MTQGWHSSRGGGRGGHVGQGGQVKAVDRKDGTSMEEVETT
jgi:hypothetical protein